MKQRMEVLRAVADFDITEEDELMVCEGDTNKASASSPQVQVHLPPQLFATVLLSFR